MVNDREAMLSASSQQKSSGPQGVGRTLLKDQCGTHHRYNAGCRCSACKRAHAEYERRRRRQRGYGRPGRVPAEPIRAHIEYLRRSGTNLKRIVEASGLDWGTVARIVYETKHQRRRTWVLPRTAERILAVKPLPPLPRALVDATEPRRMYDEMTKAGIQKARIAHALGYSKNYRNAIQWPSSGRVTAARADEIADLHWKAWLVHERLRDICQCEVPLEVSLRLREAS